MRRAVLLFGTLLVAFASDVSAATTGARHRQTAHEAAGTHDAAQVLRRDKNGKIARDRNARAAFVRANSCPATGKTSGACPGYIVDHVVPLKRGGPDSPTNMQWQTKADAAAKDKVE